KGLEAGIARRDFDLQVSYASDFSRLLRLGGERRGEDYGAGRQEHPPTYRSHLLSLRPPSKHRGAYFTRSDACGGPERRHSLPAGGRCSGSGERLTFHHGRRLLILLPTEEGRARLARESSERR